VPAEQVRAGQIGKLWGLRDIQIGDTLGVPPPGGSSTGSRRPHWKPPSPRGARRTGARCTPR
jgi:hypothetical protein